MQAKIGTRGSHETIGNWQPTWEPPDVLENAQDKIDAFLAAENAPKKNSRGRKRKRGDD